jgi:hypothetical protein
MAVVCLMKIETASHIIYILFFINTGIIQTVTGKYLYLRMYSVEYITQ